MNYQFREFRFTPPFRERGIIQMLRFPGRHKRRGSRYSANVIIRNLFKFEDWYFVFLKKKEGGF